MLMEALFPLSTCRADMEMGRYLSRPLFPLSFEVEMVEIRLSNTVLVCYSAINVVLLIGEVD